MCQPHKQNRRIRWTLAILYILLLPGTGCDELGVTPRTEWDEEVGRSSRTRATDPPPDQRDQPEEPDPPEQPPMPPPAPAQASSPDPSRFETDLKFLERELARD